MGDMLCMHMMMQGYIQQKSCRKNIGLSVLPHPLYSPDLAPNNIHLFSSLHNALKDSFLKDLVKTFMQNFLWSKLAEFYLRGINRLSDKWQDKIMANINDKMWFKIMANINDKMWFKIMANINDKMWFKIMANLLLFEMNALINLFTNKLYFTEMEIIYIPFISVKNFNLDIILFP